MTHTLPVIRMFWHDAPLSRIERLSMASFLANGHQVVLYTYDEPDGAPEGVRLRDAAQVLPRDWLFRHRRTGSVALFSDWFRYRLLAEFGGIWSDSDVVCLRPLQHPSAEIFGWQDEELVCNAILGLPAGHELAVWLYACCETPNRILPYDTFAIRLRKWRRRLMGNRRDRIRWGEYGPRGLTSAIRYFGYESKVTPVDHFYPVRADDWSSIFEGTTDAAYDVVQRSYTVHLWNNMIGRSPGFDKNGRFPADSLFERLCARYLNSSDMQR